MKQEILALLQRYIECAHQITEELRSSFNVSNLLAAVDLVPENWTVEILVSR
jgi:hypothetical protein